jgi:hypothetical protein
VIFWLGTAFGYFILTNFKNFGIMHHNDDRFYAIVETFAPVAFAIGFPVWGHLVNRFLVRRVVYVNFFI